MAEDKEIAALSQMALHHFKQGHLQQAQEACQRILRKQQHPEAILVLGMIAHERGKSEVAVKHYQQFLDIEPNHAQTHYNLGLVLNHLGRTELAIVHYTQAITIAPNNAAAQGQLADSYSKLLRWDEAITAYQRVLATQTEDVATIIKLGNAYLAALRLPEAILLYQQAITRQPNKAILHRHLGASLHRMGRTEKAIQCYKQALSLRPAYVGARTGLALVLRQLARTEEALVQLEQAITLKPDDVDAHISLALTLRQQGQTELAIEALERFLVTSPACGQVYYHISLIKPRQELIPVVEKLLNESALPNDDAINCHFALGNFLDANESFDQAFSHYQRANALQRETIVYEPREDTQIFNRLIEVYTEAFVQHKRGIGSDSRLPVFILGLPRSGTTLVEQILCSHPQVYGAGETEAFAGVNISIAQKLSSAQPPPQCMSLIDRDVAEKYSARYLQELTRQGPDATRITDKLPGNFIRIGLIKTLFPNARIIHCQRNPLDLCLSLFFHNFKALTCSFELTELGQYYLGYQRLMSHWNDLYPGDIFNIQYEELVMDQERQSRQLVDHIGLDWDERCIDFHNNERDIMSPSNMQVRQPMYKNSMNKWKPYEKHLQPLIEVLQQAR